MDILTYNQSFEIVKYIDSFDSLIWNVRYIGYGEFELVVPFSSEYMTVLERGNYLKIDDSDRTMIIEKATPLYDDEKGIMAKFYGRSLESILTRRIIWKQTTISGNLQNAVKQLITDAIISPDIADRAISNFVFKESTDSRVTSIIIDEIQYTGDNLYDVIYDLCEYFKLGFKVTLNDENQFEFELYAGVDRSSAQVTNPIIEFSTDNDNLLSSEFSMDETNYCNVTLVAGEGEGEERKTVVCGDNTGLDRRELYTDARDIQSTDDQGAAIPESEYLNMLKARGNSKLLEHILKTEIDSEVDASLGSMYKFNYDYFLGDIVDVIDFIGQQFISRVIAMTISISESEYTIHPIFQNEEVEEDGTSEEV